jgi:hypothetical protein
MLITIVNNSTADVVGPGDRTVAAGASGTFAGRTEAELLYYQGLLLSTTVQVHGTLEDADYPPLVNTMKNPADPAGGVVVLAGVGFDILDIAGAAANVAPQMYLGVFDDLACTIPSVDGTLDTITTGTIDAGDGTNRLTVTPSAAGVVACRVVVTADATVYLKAWMVAAGRVIDTSDVDTVVFTP